MNLKHVTTIVGWLIGIGVVAFGIVGFQSIMATLPGTQVMSSAAPGPSPHKTSSPQGPASGSTHTATGNPPTTGQLVALGQTLLAQQCETCHKVNGTGGQVGPDLNLVLAGKGNVVPGGKPTSAKWLTAWIQNPQGTWSEATMPNLGLTAHETQALVAYLLTLKK